MFKTSIIGYLGADCETKNENGKQFTVFRVAHTESYTDAAGQKHENTNWIDCIINERPAVCEYLKKGTLVYVDGNTSLRCYSSQKARAFVAGATIRVRNIELLGGKAEAVPSRLFNSDGTMVDVRLYYHAAEAKENILRDTSGREFLVDDNGWVIPKSQAPAEAQEAATEQTEQTNG